MYLASHNGVTQLSSRSKRDAQSEADTVQVYVVDDHTPLRGHIVRFVNGMTGFEVIGEAASGEAALLDPLREEAQLTLSDLSMSGISGIELTQKLREVNPARLIVLLSGHNEPFLIEQAFRAGACAYVVKDDLFVLEDVFKRVLEGEREIVISG